MIQREEERRLRAGAEVHREFDRHLSGPFRPLYTEEQVVPLTSVSDLDLGVVGRFLRRRRITEDDLLDFGLLREVAGERLPTLYGILGFGRTPQAHPHTTSFLIRCAAYAGEDRGASVVFAGAADDRLDEQVRRAVGWFRSLAWPGRRGPLRENPPRLPPEALREALVNAVAHRDYAVRGSAILLDVFSDRAEITSPGTLPDHGIVESMLAGGAPRARNETMANLLAEADLMEKRGRGWPLMRNAMRRFNGTEPRLINRPDGDLVRVILYFHPASGDSARADTHS